MDIDLVRHALWVLGYRYNILHGRWSPMAWKIMALIRHDQVLTGRNVT